MGKAWVLEDSERVTEVIIELLASFGIDAAPAPSLVKLSSAIKRGDILFLDWDLPGMGALDALTALATIPSTERPHIVLMAAENEPSKFVLAKAAGASFYMLKPFDRTDMADVLKRCGVEVEEAA
ncbi:response regulator [Parvularcula maris]|uniref:Response regulator n=1 Tax=Parvularcula maris TaxID=2965077 RepID=A0A9X2L7F3_9PROT|nr:response regulator [Parvularcula maris]MCQ8184329.1 response regulator [Parvularcula maris]